MFRENFYGSAETNRRTGTLRKTVSDQPAPARAPPMSTPPVPTDPSRAPRILVVEDESFVRMVAVDMLEDAGLPVAEAPDADTALQLLEGRAQAFDALFTDIDMPGSMDGLTLAVRVRARWPHIRLVVTSGRLRPGADDLPDAGFLPKPYGRSDLLGALCRAA
jgi:CheY-like chemotaxis protein